MSKNFKINPKYLVLLVVSMIGLSFASVPLYDLFCRVTGFGGTTQIAENSPDKILNKLIKVRFDSNVSSNLAFNFKSTENFSDIKVGEVKLQMKASSLKMLYQLLILAPHLQEYILKKLLVFVLKNKL